MNGLPSGMYQPGNSMIHRINPRVKLASLLFIVAAVVNIGSLVGYGICFLFAGLLIRLSQTSVSTALSSVRRLTPFFVIIFLMNFLFYGPENPWVQIWIFQPSYEGMIQGINVIARVFLLLIFSNILTVTTAPLEMTGALETMLSPLRVVKLPVGQIAMILSVAMQFIPTLFEETDMIRKAQMARGARFDSQRLTDKAKAVVPLVVPIFLAAFKRADELSLAMEARGYRPDRPYIKRKRRPLNRQEGTAVIACVLLCVVAILWL